MNTFLVMPNRFDHKKTEIDEITFLEDCFDKDEQN